MAKMTDSSVIVAVSVRATHDPLLTVQQVKDAVCKVWEIEKGPNARVEVVLMDEEEHAQLHGEFLRDPSATDVMAFPYGDDDCFGELLVNVEMAARVAAEHEHTPEQECALYVVHGCLHLLGYDDHEEEGRLEMRAAELRVMQALRG
ncbi:MAG: rRNA maturation RNase YbeY [Planctomycetes bacterium]|nr:rRNA maturation RNase YbeY [Planctomycetota bacterium]